MSSLFLECHARSGVFNAQVPNDIAFAALQERLSSAFGFDHQGGVILQYKDGMGRQHFVDSDETLSAISIAASAAAKEKKTGGRGVQRQDGYAEGNVNMGGDWDEDDDEEEEKVVLELYVYSKHVVEEEDRRDLERDFSPQASEIELNCITKDDEVYQVSVSLRSSITEARIKVASVLGWDVDMDSDSDVAAGRMVMLCPHWDTTAWDSYLIVRSSDTWDALKRHFISPSSKSRGETLTVFVFASMAEAISEVLEEKAKDNVQIKVYKSLRVSEDDEAQAMHLTVPRSSNWLDLRKRLGQMLGIETPKVRIRRICDGSATGPYNPVSEDECREGDSPSHKSSRSIRSTRSHRSVASGDVLQPFEMDDDEEDSDDGMVSWDTVATARQWGFVVKSYFSCPFTERLKLHVLDGTQSQRFEVKLVVSGANMIDMSVQIPRAAQFEEIRERLMTSAKGEGNYRMIFWDIDGQPEPLQSGDDWAHAVRLYDEGDLPCIEVELLADYSKGLYGQEYLREYVWPVLQPAMEQLMQHVKDEKRTLPIRDGADTDPILWLSRKLREHNDVE